MKLSTQPYKGTRDFYPEDMRIRQWMFGKWRKVVECFGYEEYDGPILEPLELFAAKTSEEIVNDQSFNFEDRGGRKVIMRPEMTPTVSRMVAAKRQELGYPLRLYSIPNCFRYERQQRGRLREFWQLNVDLFGVEGIAADMENILIVDALMKEFCATNDMYEIRINSRLLLNKRIKDPVVGLKTNVADVIRALDSYDKQDRDTIIKNLSEFVENPEKLLTLLENDGPSDEVKKVQVALEKLGIKVKPTETLARGFDYYTDIVFEVFDKDPENNRSMFGGGRYDGLVGQFGVEPVPTVGFGVGDVTFKNFLETHNLLPKLENSTDLVVVLIGDVYQESQELIAELRDQGINASVDMTDRKLDKKIKSAAKQGVKYALFVGEKELDTSVYVLRDLEKGEEQKLGVKEIAKTIKG